MDEQVLFGEPFFEEHDTQEERHEDRADVERRKEDRAVKHPRKHGVEKITAAKASARARGKQHLFRGSFFTIFIGETAAEQGNGGGKQKRDQNKGGALFGVG